MKASGKARWRVRKLLQYRWEVRDWGDSGGHDEKQMDPC